MFGINNADLAGPLKQFQTTEFTKTDFHKLITVINGRLGEQKLPVKTLDAVFEKWWPDLEEKINEILSSITIVDGPVRNDREVLDEILLLTRSTRHARLPTKALEELLESFIAMHRMEAQEIGGYEQSLDLLKEMSRPVRFIARKYKDESSRISELYEKFEALTYQTASQIQEEEDVPF